MIRCPFCGGRLDLVVCYPVPPATDASTWTCVPCSRQTRLAELPVMAAVSTPPPEEPGPLRAAVFLALAVGWVVFSVLFYLAVR